MSEMDPGNGEELRTWTVRGAPGSPFGPENAPEVSETERAEQAAGAFAEELPSPERQQLAKDTLAKLQALRKQIEAGDEIYVEVEPVIQAAGELADNYWQDARDLLSRLGYVQRTEEPRVLRGEQRSDVHVYGLQSSISGYDRIDLSLVHYIRGTAEPNATILHRMVVPKG